jgi:hypothetical protein
MNDVARICLHTPTDIGRNDKDQLESDDVSLSQRESHWAVRVVGPLQITSWESWDELLMEDEEEGRSTAVTIVSLSSLYFPISHTCDAPSRYP